MMRQMVAYEVLLEILHNNLKKNNLGSRSKFLCGISAEESKIKFTILHVLVCPVPPGGMLRVAWHIWQVCLSLGTHNTFRIFRG